MQCYPASKCADSSSGVTYCAGRNQPKAWTDTASPRRLSHQCAASQNERKETVQMESSAPHRCSGRRGTPSLADCRTPVPIPVRNASAEQELSVTSDADDRVTPDATLAPMAAEHPPETTATAAGCLTAAETLIPSSCRPRLPRRLSTPSRKRHPTPRCCRGHGVLCGC